MLQILRLSETCFNILHEKVSIVYPNLVQIDVLEMSYLSLMLDRKELLFNAKSDILIKSFLEIDFALCLSWNSVRTLNPIQGKGRAGKKLTYPGRGGGGWTSQSIPRKNLIMFEKKEIAQ